MRFQGAAYRAHDPKWSSAPLSGVGAATHGGRFNPKGTPALYLALSQMTAIKEANQGFARKMDPCLLCEYDVDCEDIVDLLDPSVREAVGVSEVDLACGWLGLAASGKPPPTWTLARHLIDKGQAGVIVPSFAPGAVTADVNLVLWRWSALRPHRCIVHDPSGRLPRDQSSWT